MVKSFVILTWVLASSIGNIFVESFREKKLWRSKSSVRNLSDAAELQDIGHTHQLPKRWYSTFAQLNQRMRSQPWDPSVEQSANRSGDSVHGALPANPPDNGDPESVHIFVIGDWGTFPGTGKNMQSLWTQENWSEECFPGSNSREDWEMEKKRGYGFHRVEWGDGYPICGSMHQECSWNKGGAAHSHRCNPDHEAFWRDRYAQENVANQMMILGRKVKPSFIINTGDNIYYFGVESVYDIKWLLMFEQVYHDSSLQIPWLSALGNHDYGGYECDTCLFPNPYSEDRPCSQAMIDFDNEHEWEWPAPKKRRWVMPMKGGDRWYKKSFNFPTAGVAADVFVIDTNNAHAAGMCGSDCPEQDTCRRFFAELWSRQKRWLLQSLETSAAKWKIVVGHAPPENFEASLMHEMRKRGVSVYCAGHVHQLRHDKHPSGIDVIVSGSGGGYQSAGGGLWYTQMQTIDYGFADIEAKPDKLVVRYINDFGQEKGRFEIAPPGGTGVPNWVSQAYSSWFSQGTPEATLEPSPTEAPDTADGTLDALRNAALSMHSNRMADFIEAALKYGVDQSDVYAAATSGLLSMLVKGGETMVVFRRKLRPDFKVKVPVAVADFSLEAKFDGTEYEVEYGDGCDGFARNALQDAVLLAPKADCQPHVIAANAQFAKARAVIFLEPGNPPRAAERMDDSEIIEVPLVTAASDGALEYVKWWIDIPGEVLTIKFESAKARFAEAMAVARAAGVPEDILRTALGASLQRQAIEDLEEAMGSRDLKYVQTVIEEEAGFVGTDEVDEALEHLRELTAEQTPNETTIITSSTTSTAATIPSSTTQTATTLTSSTTKTAATITSSATNNAATFTSSTTQTATTLTSSTTKTAATITSSTTKITTPVTSSTTNTATTITSSTTETATTATTTAMTTKATTIATVAATKANTKAATTTTTTTTETTIITPTIVTTKILVKPTATVKSGTFKSQFTGVIFVVFLICLRTLLG